MGLTRISGDVIQTPLNVGVVTVTSLTVGTGVTINVGNSNETARANGEEGGDLS